MSVQNTSIRKRDRIYLIDIGHEFRGSKTAITRLEQYLRNMLPPDIHLNAFVDEPRISRGHVVDTLLILTAIGILVLSFFQSKWRVIIELVFSCAAYSIIVLSIHQTLEIPIPIRWEAYLVIIFLSAHNSWLA